MDNKDNQKQPIVAIIQARMSSSRLPGKALLPIAGVPMLKRVFDRVQRASLVDKVVVATTSDASDDAIEKACAEWQVACFRGNLYDVLDRYYQAAKLYGAGTIVRITADCPMIDPHEIDKVLERFFERTATSLPIACLHHSNAQRRLAWIRRFAVSKPWSVPGKMLN